jgi:hypothetical protein
MTDTRSYDIAGATLIVTTVVEYYNIVLNMTINLKALDADEPSHSSHNLVKYLQDRLGEQWTRPEYEWWCLLKRRQITCQTGAQAQRVVRKALATTADAVSAAKLDRERRKAEMLVAIAV